MLKQLNTFQRLLDSTPLATQLVLDGSVASLFCLFGTTLRVRQHFVWSLRSIENQLLSMDVF